DREICDEAVVVGPLSLVVEDLDGEPVDRDGVLGGAQRHCGEPAVDGCGALAAFAGGLAMLLQFGAMEIFGDGPMGSRLAGEDEVAAGVLDGGNDGLAGKQVVAKIDRPKMADRGAVPGQPEPAPAKAARGFSHLQMPRQINGLPAWPEAYPDRTPGPLGRRGAGRNLHLSDVSELVFRPRHYLCAYPSAFAGAWLADR